MSLLLVLVYCLVTDWIKEIISILLVLRLEMDTRALQIKSPSFRCSPWRTRYFSLDFPVILYAAVISDFLSLIVNLNFSILFETRSLCIARVVDQPKHVWKPDIYCSGMPKNDHRKIELFLSNAQYLRLCFSNKWVNLHFFSLKWSVTYPSFFITSLLIKFYLVFFSRWNLIVVDSSPSINVCFQSFASSLSSIKLTYILELWLNLFLFLFESFIICLSFCWVLPDFFLSCFCCSFMIFENHALGVICVMIFLPSKNIWIAMMYWRYISSFRPVSNISSFF